MEDQDNNQIIPKDENKENILAKFKEDLKIADFDLLKKINDAVVLRAMETTYSLMNEDNPFIKIRAASNAVSLARYVVEREKMEKLNKKIQTGLVIDDEYKVGDEPNKVQ